MDYSIFTSRIDKIRKFSWAFYRIFEYLIDYLALKYRNIELGFLLTIIN
jgi:hypothetical protein